MKVIVDTSVWSPALRLGAKATDPNVQKLNALLISEQQVYLLGIIIQELLQGLKQKEQFLKLARYLEPFPILEPSRADYLSAAELSFNCRRRGIQSTTIDCLIATVTVQNDCVLLTSDRDFDLLATVAPLQLM